MRGIWPFRHLGLKLLSVALATLLWLVVAGEETVERGLRVPLELQQVPEGLELVGDVPMAADVRVRGASGTLSRIAAADLVVVLDLRAARPGRRLFHLTPEQVRAPSGVDVVQVIPPTVAMTFENTASRRVPIAPAIEGQPAAGYVVGTVTADPPAVEVVGPESALAKVTDVTTEPVSVAGAHGPVRETVAIGLLDPSLRLKTQRPSTVVVQIVPAPIERTIHGRSVNLRNLGENLSATALPADVDVRLRGTPDVLSHLEADDVTAYVDLAGLGAGKHILPVHADRARETGVTQIEPPTIQVRIIAKN